MSKIIDAILYARDLPWTQQVMARDESGLRVGFLSSKASSFCVQGQRARAAKDLALSQSERNKLCCLVQEICPKAGSWNDNPSRTQSDIDNMWDEVLRLAKERNL